MPFMNNLLRLLSVILAISIAIPCYAKNSHDDLVIASWNIAWFGDGINDCALRGNYKIKVTECTGKHMRNAQDMQRLSQYQQMLDADIIALQEMENIAAIRQLFPIEDWQVFISSRQISAQWAQHVAIVVRSGIQVNQHADYAAIDTSSGHLRYAIDLTIISPRGPSFRMLGIHLKSGCPNGGERDPRRACRSLWRQNKPLKDWIEARVVSGVPFIIAGDWNRHITTASDPFWSALDDGSPQHLRLYQTALGHRSQCYDSDRPFVDHIVLGGPAIDWFKSFWELSYAQGEDMHKISDHCPVIVHISPSS